MAINRLLKEDNAHFDNLYEKALLYKETFSNHYHQDIDYDPNDMGQAWLKQYGLIKEMNGKAMIANPVYKKRFATISKQHLSNIVQPNHATNENKPLVFLCHAKEDIQFVRSLYHRLKQENLTPGWMKSTFFLARIGILKFNAPSRKPILH